MLKVKAFLLSLVLLHVCNLSEAQNPNYEWKQSSSNGYTYKYVTNDPSKARFYNLKNGLTVILSPSRNEPRIQTYIAVKAGSKTDPSTHTGLAHYLEHMLFKGTDKLGTINWEKEKPLIDAIEKKYEQYTATTDVNERKIIYRDIDSLSGEAAKYAIANEYDKIGSAMGAKGSNAWTSFEETVYTEDIPGNAINKYLALQSERFRNPVLRIFHTELEAVYEEKNRSLDSDNSKVFETMFSSLFPNHNYGKQTTIGTIEHLKNPSQVQIKKYFDTYYVPNNMAVIMSGDFDPDQLIKDIDKAFAYMNPKPIPAYTFEPEVTISTPVIKEVTGPESETAILGFRFPGASSKDARTLELVGKILTNGAAGLIDINLVKKQKLLSAYAFPYTLKDYSVLIVQGNPSEGQSLEEVKALLLGELNKLKTGNFSEHILKGIINNEKKDALIKNENYASRAGELLNYFTAEVDWLEAVNYIDKLNLITKKDIVEFANKYLNDNYVVVYKRRGESKLSEKVEKPSITPITINREAQSDFFKQVNALPENEINPTWLDYRKTIQKSQAGPYPVLTVENKDNGLFKLYYHFETGSWSDKYLPLAAEYISYLGTKDKSIEEVTNDFYQLASSFQIVVNSEESYICLEGLYENLEQTVSLFENLIKNCQPDESSLNAYKTRLTQARANAKQDKNQIMQGLLRYAQYGKNNPFNHTLTNEELGAIKAESLVKIVQNLFEMPHRILYYGPGNADGLAQKITRLHPEPANGLKQLPPKRIFEQMPQRENEVYFTNYDMVQAEIFWTRNSIEYNPEYIPTISLFNEYFGGGMGSIVFQNIRESKALAYSTYSYYSPASRKEYKNSIIAYVGTQSDKFHEATKAMNELINDLPLSEKALKNAQDGLKKNMATQRITKEGILFNYLRNEKLGIDYDIRIDIYEKAPGLTFSSLKSFHDQEFSKKPYTYCIVANKNNVSDADLAQYGKVVHLALEEIFGY